MMNKLNNFFASSRRILNISQKPTTKEFGFMAKIIAIGIVVIGVIGYFVKLIASFF
ncbi:protein translocase SEC61 complex subunit gamma [archaeon]|nr:protein translocase SEC61 complex subunit gamma [archaeon]